MDDRVDCIGSGVAEEHATGAVAWLREQVALGGPVVWSGYGLSLAVAETLAAVSRELGMASYALTPGDLGDVREGKVAYLSRSGRHPGGTVDLLVTEAGASAARPIAATVLTIDDPDAGSDPWLPLRYARVTVRAVVEALGVPPTAPIELPQLPELDGEIRCILLFEKHSRVARSAVRSVREKIGRSPCEAMTFAELGHGVHSQLWARPEEHRVCIASCGGERSDAETAVRAWCESVGVRVCDLSLLDRGEGAGQAVQTFETTLALLEQFASRNDLPLTRAPIPSELDSLRLG